MTSTPGSGHNHPPPHWLDILRALIRKLRPLWAEIIRRAVRLAETPALIRRVDERLAEDLSVVEQAGGLSEAERWAVARAVGVARGGV